MRKKYSTYEETKRILRENGIKCKKDYFSSYKELGLPSTPHKYYKAKGWVNWYDFFGKEGSPTYEEAKQIVIEKGIKSYKEYISSHKELGLSSTPEKHYRDKGWTNWLDFLGKANYLEYEEAKKVVNEKGIKSHRDYNLLHKYLRLPSAPDMYYKDKGWTDWGDFIGNDAVNFPTYEEAKRILREKGINCKKEYLSSYKSLGLPSNPNGYYKGRGWTDWSDFFGKTKKTTSEERTIKVLETLSINPILLKEEAPVQIIYLLASQLDNKLARRIEELFQSTGYEDKVKWLKEQLKSLKSDSTSEPESSEEDSADELPAMDSIFDAFGDAFDDLPEDVESNIRTILDNYFHNAVNRELIEEYDG